MKKVGFIPARGGSKSVPGKNVKPLAGIPLLVYSILAARACGLRTIVNSDSSPYLEIARKWGAETMLRPQHLGRDTTSMYELLREEIPKIEPAPDAVVLLQPTTPLRKSSDVTAGIRYFMRGYDSVISVEPVPERFHPSEVIVRGKSGLKMASGVPIRCRSRRRQENCEAFHPTGSFYILKASNLEKGDMYGDKVGVFVHEPTVNINSEEDFLECEKELAERLLTRGRLWPD